MIRREWIVLAAMIALLLTVIGSYVSQERRAVRTCEHMMREARTFADSGQIMWRSPDGKQTCAYLLADE